MIFLWTFLIISIGLILLNIILYIITKKIGKISYDVFSAAGFTYDAEKDIFYSTKNAWQKNFGYTYMYDVMAPIFRIIIDTEPVKFNYNNKNWLITFWKGQYGIVTGAEIGVYATKQKKINKKAVYLPIKENEMLDMDLILYKNGKYITRVHTKHWWLAVFKLGMFSRPKELSVDVNITFPTYEMLNAFLESFRKLGYKDKEFRVIDKTFCFHFIKPRTKKVWTRSWITDAIRQYFNRKNVELYNKYLDDFIDDNNIDDSKIKSYEKIILINKFIPDILKNKDEIINKEEITKNIYEGNVIFLHNSVYSNAGEDKYE